MISFRGFFCIVFLFVVFGCSQWARNASKIDYYVSNGNLNEAYTLLTTHEEKWEKNKRNLLLYYFNRGTLAWMLGKTDESITYFKKADYFIEDLRKNYGAEALSLIFNDRVIPYPGEDYERLLLHFYQIINFMQKEEFENAEVQARRLILDLQELDDKFKDQPDSVKKERYQRDGFAKNLLGMVFDARKDYNNAFIAYRNSFDAYARDIAKNNIPNIPYQLKEDLIRTAYLAGLKEEQAYFEKQFGIKFNSTMLGKNMVFFWLNGLGPIKDQQRTDFIIFNEGNGWISFRNAQRGWIIPVYTGNNTDNQGLASLRTLSIALPILRERLPLFDKAEIQVGNTTYPLEMAQNVNALAFRVLDEKYLSILGKTLLRIATKKLAEAQLRKENPEAAAATSVLNMITEQADTRNWRSLPFSIQYSRFKLDETQPEVELRTSSSAYKSTESLKFRFNIKNGKTIFHAYHSLNSLPNPYMY